MTIFNVQIFGESVDYFCSLSSEAKVEWIKTNTNQISDELINVFLSSSPCGKKDEYCIECRGKKEKVTINEVAKRKKK